MITKTFPEKVKYLKKILKIYLLFFKNYKEVTVTVKEKSIEINFISRFSPQNFKAQEFEFQYLTERIDHFKNAVKYAFSMRNKPKK